MVARLIILLLVVIGLSSLSFHPSLADIGRETGLPIPRFVSLNKDKVYLRAGPGRRYPIDWVFKRQNLPVLVIAEFNTWRKVRDFEDIEGWVHQSMLSGRRWVVVVERLSTLRDQPSQSSRAVARMEPGVLGRLDLCQKDWCEIEVSGMSGWIQRSSIWGVNVYIDPN